MWTVVCTVMSCLAVLPVRAGENLALPADQAAGEPAWPSGIWSRPGLLDGPGSPMETLRDHGVDLRAFWTQMFMGLPAGSATHDWQYGGKLTLNATFDGARLGLWEGFSVNVGQEWNYGEDVNSLDSGALLPFDTITAFPRLGGHDSDTAISFTQKFGDDFSLSLGKFALLDMVSKTPLVGGGGYETFLNAGIAGPITGVIPPYLLGGIAKLKTEPAVFTLMVYDPRNAQDWDVISDPFSDGISTALTVLFPVKIAGRSGFYSIRGVHSTQEGLDLSTVGGGLAQLPTGSELALQKEGYWYLAANFQQFLHEDPSRPGTGWGVFGHLAFADGNPNPLEWVAYAGIGGNSPLPNRELDQWGIGYFHYGMSDDLVDGLAAVGTKWQDEQGVEVFYNFAVTPWLRLSADVQWVSPADEEQDDVIVAGFRLQTRF